EFASHNNIWHRVVRRAFASQSRALKAHGGDPVSPDHLTKPEVAELLVVSVRTLDRCANRGVGPRHILLGPRFKRYIRHEVLDDLRHGERKRALGRVENSAA